MPRLRSGSHVSPERVESARQTSCHWGWMDVDLPGLDWVAGRPGLTSRPPPAGCRESLRPAPCSKDSATASGPTDASPDRQLGLPNRRKPESFLIRLGGRCVDSSMESQSPPIGGHDDRMPKGKQRTSESIQTTELADLRLE